MNALRHPTLRRCATAFAIAAATLAAPLVARADEAMDTYRSERADCMAGRTTQSKALCLYDARLALEAAREGRLVIATEEQRQQNVLARCDAVPEDGRDSCLRIARGEGERDGSVAQGIMMMWLVETDTAVSAAEPSEDTSTQVSAVSETDQ